MVARGTHFEIFHMESGGDDLSMVSPFFTFEAEETIALELFNEWVCFIFLIQFGLGREHFTDEVGIRDGQSHRGSEPHKKCATYNLISIITMNDHPQIIIIIFLKGPPPNFKPKKRTKN